MVGGSVPDGGMHGMGLGGGRSVHGCWGSVTEPPRGGGSSTKIIFGDSRRSENTVNTHEYNTIC
jgi:hypothetical protein